MAFRKVLDIYSALLALNNFLFKDVRLFKTFKNCLSNLVQLSIFSFKGTFFRSFLNFEELKCLLSM